MSIYKNLLDRFCIEQKREFRNKKTTSILQKPFIDRNYACASDGVGAILIPTTFLEKNSEELPEHNFFMNKGWDGSITINGKVRVTDIEICLALLKTEDGAYYKDSDIVINNHSFDPDYFDSYVLQTAKVLQVEAITLIHWYFSDTSEVGDNIKRKVGFVFKIDECYIVIAPLKLAEKRNAYLYIQDIQFLENPLSIYGEIPA